MTLTVHRAWTAGNPSELIFQGEDWGQIGQHRWFPKVPAVVRNCAGGEGGTALGAPNSEFEQARLRTESPNATGVPISRQELAEMVNTWIYENTSPKRVGKLDAR